MTRAILTCSEHFVSQALNELRRFQPQLVVLGHLAPGYIYLQSPTSFDQLTAPWRDRLPVYLHHLFPVQATIPLKGDTGDLLQLKQAAQCLTPAATTIQARSAVDTPLPYSPLDIEHALNPQQRAYTHDTPRGQVLSILIAKVSGSSSGGLAAYLGVSKAAHNLSPWAGGQMPVLECVPNRAGYKLLEAIHVFGIRLRSGNLALDLGAAPGAWTTLLRRRNLKVTAVAPAPLYPWLLFDREVIYQPLLAEDFLCRCQTTYDLIVNDMKLDAQDSARLMVTYARHLRSEGIALMTIKLRGRNQQRVMDHSFRILRKAYKIIRVRQLVSNRLEVTLFLRRKG